MNGTNNDSKLSRREVLHRGLYGAGGMLLGSALGSKLRAEEAAPTPPKIEPKTKSVIQIFLWGGMSHNDTWDPKPNSGRDYLGEFTEVIDTNVPGIQLSFLFPKLARQADKFSLIRSMTHRNNGHETAAYIMQTGHLPGERLAYRVLGRSLLTSRAKNTRGSFLPMWF
jgi:hypothetical protein